MTTEEIESLAKFAAETLNGGDFYNKNYYNFRHKEAWENMISKLIEKMKEMECH